MYMKQDSKFRHPMFIIVLGALLAYEIWTVIRIARTYLGFDRQWYNIPSSVQTALIIAMAASVITIIGLIVLYMLRRVGLLILLVGIAISLYGIMGGNIPLGSRIVSFVEAIVKFLSVWYAVKAGPTHEEAIHQLD